MEWDLGRATQEAGHLTKGAATVEGSGFNPAGTHRGRPQKDTQMVPPRRGKGTFSASSSCPQGSGCLTCLGLSGLLAPQVEASENQVKLMQGTVGYTCGYLVSVATDAAEKVSLEAEAGA